MWHFISIHSIILWYCFLWLQGYRGCITGDRARLSTRPWSITAGKLYTIYTVYIYCMYTLYVYTYTIDPYCTYGLKRPGCILFKKLVIFYSTLRHHCDHIRNGSIKCDTCILDNFSTQVRIWNQIKGGHCVRAPRGLGAKAIFSVFSSIKFSWNL